MIDCVNNNYLGRVQEQSFFFEKTQFLKYYSTVHFSYDNIIV